MSKEPDKSNGEEQPGTPTFTETDIAKARKWFQKGQSLMEKKNFDYAIESYISGLEFWPEAVEEGHKACRAAALFRGGKKVSFMHGMKYKTNLKDPRRAMLNAEVLLSMDPRNVSYMEALLKNAARARCDATVMWIGEILAEAAAHEEKPNPAHFEVLREVYEELADRHADTDPPLAIAALERGARVLTHLRNLKPNDLEVSNALRDLVGKVTILKGRYASADSFRDSIRDGESQRELRDKERVVQSEDRMDQLIAQAKDRYDKDPGNRILITGLVDLLCRREEEQYENQAIDVLTRAFKDTNEYRFKMRADDVRMKQLKRKARNLQAAGDVKAGRRHAREQMEFELGIFKDRARQYPTDMRLRYEYGLRLFRARRYDEAIPVLQEARNEPKTRFLCNLCIGRCFFEKGFQAQAVDTFRQTLDAYETPDDELGKELHYWLGRSCEADGRIAEALKTYGQLIQWDYNYRKGDVRKRIRDLKDRGRDTESGDA